MASGSGNTQHDRYLALLEERNRLVRRLQAGTDEERALAEREAGFSTYFAGANDTSTATSVYADSSVNTTAGGAGGGSGGPTLCVSPSIRTGKAGRRKGGKGKRVQKKQRRNWIKESVNIKTEKGEKIHLHKRVLSDEEQDDGSKLAAVGKHTEKREYTRANATTTTTTLHAVTEATNNTTTQDGSEGNRSAVYDSILNEQSSYEDHANARRFTLPTVPDSSDDERESGGGVESGDSLDGYSSEGEESEDDEGELVLPYEGANPNIAALQSSVDLLRSIDFRSRSGAAAQLTLDARLTAKTALLSTAKKQFLISVLNVLEAVADEALEDPFEILRSVADAYDPATAAAAASAATVTVDGGGVVAEVLVPSPSRVSGGGGGLNTSGSKRDGKKSGGGGKSSGAKSKNDTGASRSVVDRADTTATATATATPTATATASDGESEGECVGESETEESSGPLMRDLVPCKEVRLRIRSTYGHPSIVGLAAVRLYDRKGCELVVFPNQIRLGSPLPSVQPVARLVQSAGSSSSVATIESKAKMWQTQIPSSGYVDICLDVPDAVAIGSMRVWNYNVSLNASVKCAKDVEVAVDGETMWSGRLEKGMGNDVFDSATTIPLVVGKKLRRGGGGGGGGGGVNRAVELDNRPLRPPQEATTAAPTAAHSGRNNESGESGMTKQASTHSTHSTDGRVGGLGGSGGSVDVSTGDVDEDELLSSWGRLELFRRHHRGRLHNSSLVEEALAEAAAAASANGSVGSVGGRGGGGDGGSEDDDADLDAELRALMDDSTDHGVSARGTGGERTGGNITTSNTNTNTANNANDDNCSVDGGDSGGGGGGGGAGVGDDSMTVLASTSIVLDGDDRSSRTNRRTSSRVLLGPTAAASPNTSTALSPNNNNNNNNNSSHNTSAQYASFRAEASRCLVEDMLAAAPSHIPSLPSGRVLTLHIGSSWGDDNYVGLVGVDVFDSTGARVTLDNPRSQIAVFTPATSLQPGVDPSAIVPHTHKEAADPRSPSNLFDGANVTRDELHMWLSPFDPTRGLCVRVDLGRSVDLALVRVWNYNASRAHTTRGVRHLALSLDDEVVFGGEIAPAAGTIGDAVEEAECILFTTEPGVLAAVESRDAVYVEPQPLSLLNRSTAAAAAAAAVGGESDVYGSGEGEESGSAVDALLVQPGVSTERPATATLEGGGEGEGELSDSLSGGGGGGGGGGKKGARKHRPSVRHIERDEADSESDGSGGGTESSSAWLASQVRALDSAVATRSDVGGSESGVAAAGGGGVGGSVDSEHTATPATPPSKGAAQSVAEREAALATASPGTLVAMLASEVGGLDGDDSSIDVGGGEGECEGECEGESGLGVVSGVADGEGQSGFVVAGGLGDNDDLVSALEALVAAGDEGDISTTSAAAAGGGESGGVRGSITARSKGASGSGAHSGSESGRGSQVLSDSQHGNHNSNDNNNNTTTTSIHTTGTNAKGKQQQRGDSSSNSSSSEKRRAGERVPPRGRELVIDFVANWGDRKYLGLSGLCVLGEDKQPLNIRPSALTAVPDSINVLPRVSGDDRTPDKLVDGLNVTTDDHHMWMVPFKPSAGETATLTIDLGPTPLQVAGIKLWNYNASVETAVRGARAVRVFLDGELLTPPSGAYIRKAPGCTVFDYGQTLYFDSRVDWRQEGSACLASAYSSRLALQPNSSRRTLRRSTAQGYSTPLLPTGFVFKILIHSTWGDVHYVGLNGVEFYDEAGELLEITAGPPSRARGKGGSGSGSDESGRGSSAGDESASRSGSPSDTDVFNPVSSLYGSAVGRACASPSSINVLPGVTGDRRTVDKLFDGVNYGAADNHMWLAPFAPGRINTVFVVFKRPTTVSRIRVWNYSKTPERGVDEFEILLDDVLIYQGSLRKSPPMKSAGAAAVPPTTILFTDDPETVEAERGGLPRPDDSQSVRFINDGRVVEAPRVKRPVMLARKGVGRPTTGAAR